MNVEDRILSTVPLRLNELDRERCEKLGQEKGLSSVSNEEQLLTDT